MVLSLYFLYYLLLRHLWGSLGCSQYILFLWKVLIMLPFIAQSLGIHHLFPSPITGRVKRPGGEMASDLGFLVLFHYLGILYFSCFIERPN